MRVRQTVTSALRPLTSLYHRIRPGIRILMYHRVCHSQQYDQLAVSPEMFQKQIAWLAGQWRVISLGQALDELESRNEFKPSVVITFDDGYLDNLTYAIPVLEQYKAPATIFVTTDFCDQSRAHPRYGDSGERVHLNWEEVFALSRRPGIDIGSHTVSHPYLAQMGDQDATREIELSKSLIEEHIQKPVSTFCYPSGNYSSRDIKIVEAAGYRCAVTVSPGVNRKTHNMFTLRRTEVNNKDDETALVSKMEGAYDPVHMILDWRRQHRYSKLPKLDK